MPSSKAQDADKDVFTSRLPASKQHKIFVKGTKPAASLLPARVGGTPEAVDFLLAIFDDSDDHMDDGELLERKPRLAFMHPNPVEEPAHAPNQFDDYP